MKAFIEEIIGNPLSAEDWTLLSGIIKKRKLKKGIYSFKKDKSVNTSGTLKLELFDIMKM